MRLKNPLRRRMIVIGNVALLLLAGLFVLNNRSVSQTVTSNTLNSVTTTRQSEINPLDELSAAQIAETVAHLTNMSEATAVHNNADSEKALLATIPNDTTTLGKPQIVSTQQKSKRDIINYTAQAGDTIERIAAKFGVSVNSIRWSNDLSRNYITAGAVLQIPPGDGIVYKVKNGDSIDTIVERYQANKEAFITVNDAEGGNLVVGELVWIPNGQQPLPSLNFNTSAGFAWGSAAVYSNNGYDYGYCTYWVALRRAQIGQPVPSNLGDAVTWKILAPQAGLGVGHQPQVGAVWWVDPTTMSGYWRAFGHVGFVEKINPDGSVWTSNMNSSGYVSMDTNSPKNGGWGVVSYRLLSPDKANSAWYIY